MSREVNKLTRRSGIEALEIGEFINRTNPTILDIGANNGEMSENFSNWFPYAQIFAFEPDPRAIRKILERNLSSRVHLTSKALGRDSGKASFFQSGGFPPNLSSDELARDYPEGWDQSGSLRAPRDHITDFPWVTFDNAIEIDVITLDRWAYEQGVKFIDFIWADVQGAESDLIIGGAETLRQTRYLYTEFSERELYEGSVNAQQISDMLPDFDIVEIFQHDVLLKNRRLTTPWAIA